MIYELIAEDLTQLGSMSNQKTTEKSLGLFSELAKAQTKAEKHYGDTIVWENYKNNITSGDLRWVMYTIIPRQVK